MQVIYDPSKEGRDGPVWFDKLQLMPGSNTLSEAEATLLKAHPDLAAYTQSGALQLIEPKPKPPPRSTKLTQEKPRDKTRADP